MSALRLGLVILTAISILALSGTSQPVLAGFQPKLDLVNITAWSIGGMALSTVGYFMYKNSPAQRAKGYREELGPGEWFLAGYMGLSYLPPTDWKFTVNGTSTLTGPQAKDINYQPGVQGGIKFGRYFDSHPWFGTEVETNFSRNNIRGDQGRISPPQPGLPAKLLRGSDWFMIWAMQTNLLARYGFFRDKEVTFGHLQPYIGIGPGFEIVYGRYDSTKNLAIEGLAGVRYMFTQKLALFFEYKYSYQFAIEYQDVPVNNKSGPVSAFTFDLPHHRFVIGVSYHFKNLYGN